ncbi:hypothetical protein [Sporomusa sp.]|uniref:hypothetical protein n=1 Tax=Sporomusa sp. TaxID=2078658 RepID=UPI002B92816D|nr:hypothetical protein [Sporomusa sp.]HWR09705.1 hypothetical protein [Sporomusa sp.]
MVDIGQLMALLVLSWLFWFALIYGFIYPFQRKLGKPMALKDRIILAAKVSLLCASAAAAIRFILWSM